MEQEYNRSPEKHYRANPELRKQITTGKVVHNFYQNRLIKIKYSNL